METDLFFLITPAANLQEITKKVYQIEEIYMSETCTDMQNKDDKL